MALHPVASLYRRSLKLALDWAVHRQIWRGQAVYIRSLFDANKNVRDPRQQKVLLRETEKLLETWKHPDPYRAPTAPGGNKYERNLPARQLPCTSTMMMPTQYISSLMLNQMLRAPTKGRIQEDCDKFTWISDRKWTLHNNTTHIAISAQIREEYRVCRKPIFYVGNQPTRWIHGCRIKMRNLSLGICTSLKAKVPKAHFL